MKDLDYVKDLYGVSKRKYEIPEDLLKVIAENFYVYGKEMNVATAKEFIASYPQLLNHTATTLQNRFDLFEEFGWTSKIALTVALKKNKNIFTMNEEDLTKKVFVFNSLGFDSDFLLKHPLFLSCPLKDIKLKFMLGKFEGNNVKDLSFFMQSLKKSYARICYLQSIDESTSVNLTLTKNEFHKKFEVDENKLQAQYQLSAEAINAIERNYNLMRERNKELPYISLTKKEKQESITRISLKELKKMFLKEIKMKKLQQKIEKMSAEKDRKAKEARIRNARYKNEKGLDY